MSLFELQLLNDQKHNPLYSRVTVYFLCIVFIIGYILDLQNPGIPQIVTYANYATIILSAACVFLFYLKKITIKQVFQLQILGFLMNLVISHFVHPIDMPNYTNIFLRNIITLGMLVPIYGIYCGKNNLITLGVVYYFLYIDAIVRIKDSFLTDNSIFLLFNGTIYVVATYIILQILEKMHINQLQLNSNLQLQKDQLLLKNNDLEQKNQQISQQAELLKQSEHIIKESEGNLNALINNRNESFWSINTEYNFITFNHFFKEAYFKSFNIELKKGINSMQIISPDIEAFWRPKYEKAFIGEKVVFEFDNIVDSIKTFYEVSLNPIIVDGKVTGVSALSIDITHRKHTELQMKKYAEELDQSIKDKDLFMSILAHDLRSPFNTLLGFTDFILNNLHKFDSVKLEAHLRKLNKISQNTYDLLEDLLLWSKSQLGKLSFEPQFFAFNDICQEMIMNFNENAKEKNISIECLDQNQTYLLADLNMFKTILRNLITNAIKFTNFNGEITVNILKDSENTTIVVSDNGVGINEENQIKIWDMSQKHTNPGTSGEKGTGLGLILCREFVEKHRGKIWVESNLGQGSSFIFTLPNSQKL